MTDPIDLQALMNAPLRSKPTAEKLPRPPIRRSPLAHAMPPGSGPAGETCKGCANFLRLEYAKVYFKCGLTSFTHGPATDIRAGDAACSKWANRPEAAP